MGAGIAYVDGPRFRRALLAAADWVAAARDELNRLNVFPVPDGDTGTNLCLTLREVARGLRDVGDAPLPRVTTVMAEASVRGARGNSGMMLSQFLLGLREGLGDRLRARAADLADGIGRGFDRLQGALDDPVEGTILTVAREAAAEAALARDERDLRVFMRRVVRRAETAVSRTPELLAALRASGVVDAGAKGFARLLDGVSRLIDEGTVAVGAVDRPVPDAAAEASVAPERDYRYCTEILVRGAALPAATDARRALRSLGSSLVLLQTGDLLKAHIHTDAPDAVFELGRGWGALEHTKAEDMRAQHGALVARRRIAFVTDTASDLPDAVVFERAIGLVPTQLILEDRVYRDRLELSAPEFFERLRTGVAATTSQPTPQAFAEALGDAGRVAEQVVVVALSAGLSGTCASAVAAARRLDPAGERIHVWDSRAVSLAEGFLVMRGSELAELGWEAPAIVGELQRVRDQSGGFFTVDGFERLVRSGRVSRLRGWLGTRLDMKPILRLSRAGGVDPVARVRGRAAARARMLELLSEALAGGPRELRLGVAHAAIPEFAAELKEELVRRFRPKQCLVVPITPVLAAHTGIGAWGVFYQVEDGTKA